MKKTIKLDAVNKRILIALQNNARLSNLELAEIVSLSPSACLQRTKALQDAGYIKQYVMVVDLERLCYCVMAYLEITLHSHDPVAVKRLVKLANETDELLDFMKVSGDSDYIAFTIAGSNDKLNKLCERLLGQDSNIKTITPRIVLDKPKWFAGYPLTNLSWRNDEDID